MRRTTWTAIDGRGRLDGRGRRDGRGMLSPNGLPGVAQTALAALGVTLPARYWVLDFRRSPDDVINAGRAFTMMGLLISVIAGAAWWLRDLTPSPLSMNGEGVRVG